MFQYKKFGGVAQLAIAFGSYPKGRRFESHRRYQKLSTFLGAFFVIVVAPWMLVASLTSKGCHRTLVVVALHKCKHQKNRLYRRFFVKFIWSIQFLIQKLFSLWIFWFLSTFLQSFLFLFLLTQQSFLQNFLWLFWLPFQVQQFQIWKTLHQ